MGSREPTPTPFGLRLREFREKAGLSARQLSADAGLSLSVVSQLECGRIKNPTIRVVELLAQTLGVPVETLVPSN